MQVHNIKLTADNEPYIALIGAIIKQTMRDYDKALRKCAKIDKELATVQENIEICRTALKAKTGDREKIEKRLKELIKQRRTIITQLTWSYSECDGLSKWFDTKWAESLSFGNSNAQYFREQVEKRFIDKDGNKTVSFLRK